MPNVFVFANKTTNIYEILKDHPQKLFHDNVTKAYQKAPTKLEASINQEPKIISTKLKTSNQVNPTCRLINPSKTNLEKWLSNLWKKINSDITEKLQLNQWLNAGTVWNWFNGVTDKSNYIFIQLGIKELCLSVTEIILHQTLKFAKQHTNTDKNNLRIINHCCKSLLFSDNKAWKKKWADSWLDVTMVSFDGAEICEILGPYIQSRIEKILPKSNSGLYLRYGLTSSRNLNEQQTDKVRKNIIGV